MERPSHIIIPTSHRYRLPLLALAASVQIGVVWLFLHGLATGKLTIIRDVVMSDVKTPDKPRNDPPPPPKLIDRIVVPTPIVDKFAVEPSAGPRSVIPASDAGTGAGPTTPLSPAVPDRPAVSIASTHITPPYPVVARRTGAEGKVTLLLTVAATGRVSAAQIVASSGSEELDQAARLWVLAHWAYRPALDHGQPVPSQATATMAFNLKDAR